MFSESKTHVHKESIFCITSGKCRFYPATFSFVTCHSVDSIPVCIKKKLKMMKCRNPDLYFAKVKNINKKTF